MSEIESESALTRCGNLAHRLATIQMYIQLMWDPIKLSNYQDRSYCAKNCIRRRPLPIAINYWSIVITTTKWRINEPQPFWLISRTFPSCNPNWHLFMSSTNEFTWVRICSRLSIYLIHRTRTAGVKAYTRKKLLEYILPFATFTNSIRKYSTHSTNSYVNSIYEPSIQTLRE